MYAPEIIIISLLTTKKLNYKETSINSTGRKDMCVVMVLRVNNTNIFLNQQCVITNKEETSEGCLRKKPISAYSPFLYVNYRHMLRENRLLALFSPLSSTFQQTDWKTRFPSLPLFSLLSETRRSSSEIRQTEMFVFIPFKLVHHKPLWTWTLGI